MGKKNDVTVDFLGRSKTSQAAKQTNNDIDSVDKKSKQSTDSIKTGWAEATAAVFAAVKAWQKLSSIAGDLTSAYKVQAEAQQNLSSVLRATGGAAGFTAEQLFKQAAALQDLTKIGDEVIIQGQGILATFKNVSGVNFQRTIKSALDLSRVLKTNLNSQVLQLGKALNDPITGLTALNRAGITFTEDQKELIRGFVELNQLAEAQNVILNEVEAQVGGVAEAYGALAISAGDDLANNIGDLKEAFGELITEQLEPIIRTITEVIKFLKNLSPEVKALILGVGQFIAIGATLLITIGAIKTALVVLIPIIKSTALAVSSLLGPVGLIIGAVGLAATTFISLKGAIDDVNDSSNDVEDSQKAVNKLLDAESSQVTPLIEKYRQQKEILEEIAKVRIEGNLKFGEIQARINRLIEEENELQRKRAEALVQIEALNEASKDLPVQRIAAINQELQSLEALKQTRALTQEEEKNALTLQVLLEEEKRKAQEDQLRIDLLRNEQAFRRLQILFDQDKATQEQLDAQEDIIIALRKELGIQKAKTDELKDQAKELTVLQRTIEAVISDRQDELATFEALAQAQKEFSIAVTEQEFERASVLAEVVGRLREILGLTKEIAEVEQPEPTVPTLGQDFVSQLGFDTTQIGDDVAASIADAIDSLNLDQDFNSILQAVTGFSDLNMAMGPIVNAVLQLVEVAPNILALLNPAQTILSAFVSTIGPRLNEILAPLVGILNIAGQTIGVILIPALELLIPFVELIARWYVFFYNKVIQPVGNAIITVFDTIKKVVVGIINGIIGILNSVIGIFSKKAKIAEVSVQEAEQLNPITINTLLAAAEGATPAQSGLTGDFTDTTVVTGGTSSIQRVPDIYVTINIDGNVIGAGGLEEVGEFVVDSIQEFVGAGGSVTIIQGEA